MNFLKRLLMKVSNFFKRGRVKRNVEGIKKFYVGFARATRLRNNGYWTIDKMVRFFNENMEKKKTPIERTLIEKLLFKKEEAKEERWSEDDLTEIVHNMLSMGLARYRINHKRGVIEYKSNLSLLAPELCAKTTNHRKILAKLSKDAMVDKMREAARKPLISNASA